MRTKLQYTSPNIDIIFHGKWSRAAFDNTPAREHRAITNCVTLAWVRAGANMFFGIVPERC